MNLILILATALQVLGLATFVIGAYQLLSIRAFRSRCDIKTCGDITGVRQKLSQNIIGKPRFTTSYIVQYSTMSGDRVVEYMWSDRKVVYQIGERVDMMYNDYKTNEYYFLDDGFSIWPVILGASGIILFALGAVVYCLL